MALGTTEVESAPREPGRPVDRRWLLAAGLVVVLVVGGVLAWDWRHLDQRYKSGYGIKPRVSVGEPVWTTLVHHNRDNLEEVTVTEIEPIVRTDGAEVEVEYLICELDQGNLAREKVGGFGYGLGDRDVDRYCATTTPAKGATFDPTGDSLQELLVGVTATRPGRTIITGHHIEFENGWRVGDDDIAVEIDLAVRRSR